MVTAILVPIVIIYFYWVTKKEMQEYYQKWLQLEEIPEEAVVSGRIIEVSSHKERFYYQRFNFVSNVKIDTGSKVLTVKKITPLRKGVVPSEFKVGDWVTLYGNWKDGYFSINRAIKSKKSANCLVSHGEHKTNRGKEVPKPPKRDDG